MAVISRSAPYNVANQELLNTAIIEQVGNKANTADLKPHAFNDLATEQGTETDKAPSNKLLTESSFSRVYRSLQDINPTFDDYTDMITVLDAMEINSIASYNVEADDSTVYPSADLQVHIFKTKSNRITCFAYRKVWNNILQYFWVGGLGGSVGSTYRWAGWRRVFTSDDISTVMPTSSAAASNEKVLSEKVVYDEFAKKAPLANPTFTGTVTVPDATVSGAAVNKGQLDLKANDNEVVKLTTDQTIAGVKTFSSSPIVPTPSVGGAAANKDYVDTAIGNIGSVLDALNGEVI